MSVRPKWGRVVVAAAVGDGLQLLFRDKNDRGPHRFQSSAVRK